MLWVVLVAVVVPKSACLSHHKEGGKTREGDGEETGEG